VDQDGRDVPERLGVVGDDGPSVQRGHERLGRRGVADDDLSPGGGCPAPALLGGEQLPLRDRGRAHRHRDLRPVRQRAVEPVERHLAHRAGDGRGGGRQRRRRLGVPEHLLEPAQRVAQLELAEHLAQAGAVGRADELGRRVDRDLDVPLDRGQDLRDAGVLGVVGQVLLALGARDLVDVRQDVLERAELLQQVGRGLVPDPGIPGMLSDVSPLRP
jgi:hypothetical protein